LARGVLPGQRQEPALLESLAYRLRGPRHHRQVAVADLARAHRLHAGRHCRQLLADLDPVPGDLVGQMTVEAEPVGGAVVAGVFQETVLQELEGEDRGLELEEGDLTLPQDQFLCDFILRWRRLEHEKSVRMFEANVKLICAKRWFRIAILTGNQAHPAALLP